jgi:hypothetical protein
MDHPVEIDTHDSDVERVQQLLEIELRVSDEQRRKIDDLDAMAPVAQVALKGLEPHREVFVEGGDWNVSARAQEWKVDVSTIPKIENGGGVQEQQVGGKCGKSRCRFQGLLLQQD